MRRRGSQSVPVITQRKMVLRHLTLELADDTCKRKELGMTATVAVLVLKLRFQRNCRVVVVLPATIRYPFVRYTASLSEFER